MKRLLFTALAGILVSCAGLLWYVQGGLERGRDLLARDRPADARTALGRYQWLHPHDEPALLVLAEAWARDDGLPPRQAAGRAVALLDRIGDDPNLAAQARLQSARLRFLILHEPCGAEQDLRASLELRPDSFEANYLMWKILDLTRRYYCSEPFFRGCFDAAEEARREQLLREWYFSQFSTFIAASELDQMMGFATPGEPSDAVTEHKRLFAFARSEPGCALNHAMLAGWSDEYHLDFEKWDRFEMAWERADQATHPAAYAVLFDLLLEQGRFDEAADVIKAWPQPRTGYDFKKREGVYHAEVTNDATAAIAACRAAISEWPGPVDWQLRHRLAGLLVRAGQVTAAEEVRKEAKRLEKLMEVEFHSRLRKCLLEEPSRENYLRMADFYADIGRRVESRAWNELAEQASHRLRTRNRAERAPFGLGEGILQDF